jgi:hypothetical protein
VVGQPIVAHRTVIALDISVLLRLSRLDEVNADAAFGGPGQRHGADVHGKTAVIESVMPEARNSVPQLGDTVMEINELQRLYSVLLRNRNLAKLLISLEKPIDLKTSDGLNCS